MSSIVLIESRERDIDAELSELSRKADALHNEKDELAVALRVLRRLAPETEMEDEVIPPVAGEERSKPAGTPTIPEMILEVLGQAKNNGLRGLEPKQMRLMIAEKWWPEMPNEAANSIAWRMWKRNQLWKHDSLYMLPQKEEAAVTPSGDETTASAQEQPAWGSFGSPSARPLSRDREVEHDNI